MENISVLTKCNVLFNNKHLILILFFSLIEIEFELKITFITAMDTEIDSRCGK